ncbi:MAG: T9SS type A sorting domain-containing protein [Ignavibacteria bacterium]|nr:T9SS type A sorting domain-containing protein [Ignavibacteria bacterium]
MVQLRLVITNNVDPYYSLSDKFSDANYNLSKKKARKEINYKGLLGEKVYSYELIQNYPNPFNPVTKIRYSVKETKPVMIKLYDIVGREVATLVNEVKDAGEYEIELNAGKFGLSSGVYFYQMKAGDFTSIKKMVVLK